MTDDAYLTETHPEIPFLLPRYPTLGTDLVGQAAVQGKLVQYPQISRSLSDPPIPSQAYVNLSYMLLKDPETLESGKKVYGYVKFRGAHPTQEAAVRDGERLIREVESRFEVRVALAGQWIPITEDSTRIQNKIDVVTSDEGDKPAIHDEALRQKRAEEQRIRRELREHEDELRAESKISHEEKERSLDGYITKRSTVRTLLEAQERYEYQLKALRYNLGRVTHELAVLESDHPEYTDQWLDRYNEERAKFGTPAYIPGESELTYHTESVKAVDISQPYPVNNELRYAKMNIM